MQRFLIYDRTSCRAQGCMHWTVSYRVVYLMHPTWGRDRGFWMAMSNSVHQNGVWLFCYTLHKHKNTQ